MFFVVSNLYIYKSVVENFKSTVAVVLQLLKLSDDVTGYGKGGKQRLCSVSRFITNSRLSYQLPFTVLIRKLCTLYLNFEITEEERLGDEQFARK